MPLAAGPSNPCAGQRDTWRHLSCAQSHSISSSARTKGHDLPTFCIDEGVHLAYVRDQH